MSQVIEKPLTKKTVLNIEVFSIEQPVELITNKDSAGKVTQHWRMATFYFTTHDRPVTVNGHQHVPLSFFDQVRWDELTTV